MPSALILYQYFHPDDVVSAVHLTEFAEGLVQRGWSVTAMPCNRSCRSNEVFSKRDSVNGVRIERVWRPGFPQAKSWGRLLNALWMLAAWSLKAITQKPDALIIGTDPILSAAVATPWKILRPHTLTAHWCFDLYPEAAVADGILKPGLLLSLINRIMTSAYRNMNLLADIGECMASRLFFYPSNAVRTRLWPWALVEPNKVPDIDPTQRQLVFGAAKLGILYSGSFGRAHSFAELLNIARYMRDVDAHFSFGIRGNRVKELREALTTDDRNISFSPFAPADQLEARLSCADIQVVTLRPEWTGTVVPSKFFGALAAGRPVLFIGSESCAVAQIIRRFDLGWVCTPGGEASVAAELAKLAIDTSPLRDLQQRCFETYHQHFARETVLDHFDRELRSILPASLRIKTNPHETSYPNGKNSYPAANRADRIDSGEVLP